MKKLITISLFVFWAVVVAVLASGLIFYQDNKDNNPALALKDNDLPSSSANFSSPLENSSSSAGKVSSSALLAKAQAPAINLSETEVAKYASVADCWMIIDNKVYNVTSYVGSHTGGVAAIAAYCGKDATAAFTGLPHSQNASAILASFYLGDVGSVIGRVSACAKCLANPHSCPVICTQSYRDTRFCSDLDPNSYFNAYSNPDTLGLGQR